MKAQRTRELIATIQPCGASARLLNLQGAPAANDDAIMTERLRRYFSDFAAAYIQQEVRRTGKPLGRVVEELLMDRVSVAPLASRH